MNYIHKTELGVERDGGVNWSCAEQNMFIKAKPVLPPSPADAIAALFLF